MNETEWLNGTDPQALVAFVGRFRPNERKLRLYAVAGCRRIAYLLGDERSREAVEIAEQFADGHVTEEARGAVWEAADQATTDIMFATPVDASGATSNWHSPNISASAASNAVSETDSFIGPGAELFYLAANPIEAAMLEARERGGDFRAVAAVESGFHVGLLRDIFGNPFRTVAFSPEWRTDTAIDLARTMYETREFGAMPILADALQDVGCDNDDILDHCRAPGPHVRGCWVCDLVLGKS